MENELNYKYCIALASDVPDITVDYLCESVESLKTHDVVIGPSKDGGYYLLGMKMMYESVFKNKTPVEIDPLSIERFRRNLKKKVTPNL